VPAKKSKPGPDTSDREIVMERLLDAPRELVWKVWTEQEHIDRWWGPDGFRNETHAMDVRRGGAWRYMMHGPDGTDYPNRIDYLEVVKPERLVYDHGGGREGEPADFRVTVTFEARGSRTQLTMRLVFPTAEARDTVVREYGAIEGGEQTLNHLEQYLAAMLDSQA
jgi:uncharacterized protein YndB with AHSA1/START domain